MAAVLQQVKEFKACQGVSEVRDSSQGAPEVRGSSQGAPEVRGFGNASMGQAGEVQPY